MDEKLREILREHQYDHDMEMCGCQATHIGVGRMDFEAWLAHIEQLERAQPATPEKCMFPMQKFSDQIYCALEKGHSGDHKSWSETLGVIPAAQPAMPSETERIWCMNCGKSVSTPVPKPTIVRAYVECPECMEEKAGRSIAAQSATPVSVAGWCEESIAGHIRSCEVLIDEEQRMPAPDNTLIAVLCDSIRLSRELSTRQPIAAQGTDGLRDDFVNEEEGDGY